MTEFNELTKQARKADLYSFLLDNHPQDIIKEGRYLRLKIDKSVVVKEGHSGFTKYNEPASTGHGNGIDLLTNLLDYTPYDAIMALTGFGNSTRVPHVSSQPSTVQHSSFPERDTQAQCARAYLSKTRGISWSTIHALIKAGLLYQDTPYHNAIFLNHEKDYCEIRGTCSFKEPFHGIRRLKRDAFWSFRIAKDDVEVAYICESAIDAISLYELHKALRPSMYCSIGGVSNQSPIERIASNQSYQTVLAVDNDEAGTRCASYNAHLNRLTPVYKDWNEDLLRL